MASWASWSKSASSAHFLCFPFLSLIFFLWLVATTMVRDPLPRFFLINLVAFLFILVMVHHQLQLLWSWMIPITIPRLAICAELLEGKWSLSSLMVQFLRLIIILILLFRAWNHCNMLIHSWILNYVSPSISQSIVFMENAMDVRNDLKKRFAQGNLVII